MIAAMVAATDWGEEPMHQIAIGYLEYEVGAPNGLLGIACTSEERTMLANVGSSRKFRRISTAPI